MSNLSQFFGGGPKVWVSGTTYAVGDQVFSPAGNYQVYVRIVAGAGATDPTSDATNWAPYGERAIKSIQRGVISMSTASSNTGTATISAVDVSRTRIRFLGSRGEQFATDVAGAPAATIVLTNSTTLTVTRSQNGGRTATVSYELEETY